MTRDNAPYILVCVRRAVAVFDDCSRYAHARRGQLRDDVSQRRVYSHDDCSDGGEEGYLARKRPFRVKQKFLHFFRWRAPNDCRKGSPERGTMN